MSEWTCLNPEFGLTYIASESLFYHVLESFMSVMRGLESHQSIFPYLGSVSMTRSLFCSLWDDLNEAAVQRKSYLIARE